MPVAVVVRDDHARPRRLRLDVLHRREAEPDHRRRAGGQPPSSSPQAGGPRIGLVAFAGHRRRPRPARPPTPSSCSARSAACTTSFGTAIGEGILTSLDAIAQVDPSVAPTGATVTRSRGAGYADDVIVVLTDGSNNRGRRPADRGAGRPPAGACASSPSATAPTTPAPLACSSTQFGGFGGGGGGGLRRRLRRPAAAAAAATRSTPTTARSGRSPRPPAARSTARRTPASSAGARPTCPAAFTIVRKHVDIAAWFAAVGGLLIAAAVALSLWWNRTRRRAAPAPSADPASLHPGPDRQNRPGAGAGSHPFGQIFLISNGAGLPLALPFYPPGWGTPI